jgi:hypothetical protein
MLSSKLCDYRFNVPRHSVKEEFYSDEIITMETAPTISTKVTKIEKKIYDILERKHEACFYTIDQQNCRSMDKFYSALYWPDVVYCPELPELVCTRSPNS